MIPRPFTTIRWLRCLAIPAAIGIAALLFTLLKDTPSSAETRSMAVNGQASEAPAPAAAEVRVEAVGTQRSGITGRPRIEVRRTIAVGDLATWLLQVTRTRDGNLCAAGFVTPSDPAEPAVRWEIQARVVGATDNRTTVEVRWTRSASDTVTPGTPKDDLRTVTLGPSDVHVLDFVDSNNASSSCASLLVRISAQPAGPRVRRPISADIWTVDEGSVGGSRSVHQHVEGMTGEEIGFQFPPLDFSAAGAGRARPIQMSVNGTLVATVTQDRLVDVTLNAVRSTSWGASRVGGEGRVQFRSAAGETAAVLLPQPGGRLTFDPSAPSGTGVIDLARAFSGHRVSVYVKVDVK